MERETEREKERESERERDERDHFTDYAQRYNIMCIVSYLCVVVFVARCVGTIGSLLWSPSTTVWRETSRTSPAETAWWSSPEKNCSGFARKLSKQQGNLVQ